VKAQFKYAFRAGLQARGIVFCITFPLFLVFVTLSYMGVLPFAAHVTAVSLGGMAVTAMIVANIIGDVSIARNMFSAPGAYLQALTPAPRRTTLFAGVITMTAMDIVTMATVITGEVLLAMNFSNANFLNVIGNAFQANAVDYLRGFQLLVFFIASYLFLIITILLCVAVRKSWLYDKRAAGLLTALFAIGIAYVTSISPLLLVPFGVVNRLGLFITITLTQAGSILYTLLVLIEAAALFALTSRLMERKLNL